MAAVRRPGAQLRPGACHPAGLADRTLPDRRGRQRPRPGGQPLLRRRPAGPLLAPGPDLHPAAPVLRGAPGVERPPGGARAFPQFLERGLLFSQRRPIRPAEWRPEQLPVGVGLALRLSLGLGIAERVAERVAQRLALRPHPAWALPLARTSPP